jgi:hypothetical protein
MKWIGFIVAGLAILAIVVFLIGYMLPSRYQATLNIRLKQSPEKLWAALHDFERYPVTAAMRRNSRRLSDENGLPVWEEDIGSSKITVRTAEERPQRYIKRMLSDSATPMTAEAEIHIEPTDEGCKVTASHVTLLPRGTWHVPIFRVMMKLTGSGRQSLKQYWDSVAEGLGDKPQYE